MDKASYYLSVARSQDLIRRYLAARSQDPDEVSDLIQESMAALLDAYPRFRGACRFESWVHSICRNVYRKHVYYQVRRRRLDRSLSTRLAVSSAVPGGPLACSGCLEADEAIDLEATLAALEPADRRLYRCYYVEGRSVAELAALLDKTEGTTKWLLYRLRGRIRDAILGTRR